VASFAADLGILWRTVRIVATGADAYSTTSATRGVPGWVFERNRDRLRDAPPEIEVIERPVVITRAAATSPYAGRVHRETETTSRAS
jgi:hypothetical protein